MGNAHKLFFTADEEVDATWLYFIVTVLKSQGFSINPAWVREFCNDFGDAIKTLLCWQLLPILPSFTPFPYFFHLLPFPKLNYFGGRGKKQQEYEFLDKITL